MPVEGWLLSKLSFLILTSCFSVQTFAAQLQFPYVPDQRITTGDFCTRSNPDYLGDAYSEKIPKCTRNVIQLTKNKIYEMYGVMPSCRSQYTIDHFIPLSIGGNNSVENLWPEAKSIKALRQNLELVLFQKLRDGKISQAEAIRQIREAKFNPPITQQMKFCTHRSTER